MNKLFLGLLFVLLDFNINFGQCSIGLVPDWLGFWFLHQGLMELSEEWDGFRNGRIAAIGLLVYSAVLYIMDLFALSAQTDVVVWILSLVYTVVFLFLLRQIAKGICYMEDTHRWDLEGGKLESLWMALAVIDILGVALSLVPVVGAVCNLAALVVAVCYLAALNGTKKRYHEYVD